MKRPVTFFRSPSHFFENQATKIKLIMKTAKKICKNEGIKQSGYRYIFNSGENGGQTVNHLHLHIIGGRRLKWPPG